MNETTVIKDMLSSVSLFFKDLETPIELGRGEIRTLLHIFSGVIDFRMKGKIKYKLENLLAICFILALKNKFHSFNYVTTYLKVKEDWFVEVGLINKGEFPSHDTFRRVFGHLDANSLRDVFLERIKQFLEYIDSIRGDKSKEIKLLSGDGKTFNGSGREGNRNLNVFNIYNASESICVSSIPLSDKQSEISEFQRMLPKYDLRKTMVTADALHTQRKTCEIIIKKKGLYTFKVKNNQRALLDETVKAINDPTKEKITFSHNECEYEMVVRKKSDVYGIDWPGLRSYIKMVSHKRDAHKKAKSETHYFISSSNNPTLIAEAIDNRWKIEDDLHKFKDVYLKEDACTFQDKNAVKVMATINNIVFSLYKIASAARNDKSMMETIIRFEDEPLDLISFLLPLFKKANLSRIVRENMRGVKKA